MSAPVAANSARNALGMRSRKSFMDGWSRRLGQMATYIATSSVRLTAQASRLRRWSYRVFDATLRSMLGLRRVIGQERLLQLCLRAFQVEHPVPGQLLDQRVEGRLGC